MRPLTAAALVITAGLLAALPFRRPALEAQGLSAPGIATGPRGATLDVASVNQVGQWPEGATNFDPSLAWQPLPIRTPQRLMPELPPMPDSYYDAAFELERPDPVRRRFSAAVDYRQSPHGDEAADVGAQAGGDAASDAGLQSSRQPPAQRQQWTADELLQDRFVYTPIQPTQPRFPLAKEAPPRGTQAQQASAGRPGIATQATEGQSGEVHRTPAEGEEQRPRQFIREPQ